MCLDAKTCTFRQNSFGFQNPLRQAIVLMDGGYAGLEVGIDAESSSWLWWRKSVMAVAVPAVGPASLPTSPDAVLSET
jgi:hypothetical protein